MDTEHTSREFTHERKMEVIKRLQQCINLSKLSRGDIKLTAVAMGTSRNTVTNLWKDFKLTSTIRSGKIGRVGRKPTYTQAEITDLVRMVPEGQRSTMRDIAEATGIPLTPLHRSLKQGTFERRSSRLKPLLTDANAQQHKDRRKVYLTKGETVSRRVCKSKRFISKVIFLVAVARPRMDEDRGVMFDGKIGMWPVVKYLPAARSSRNRPAGTLVTTLFNVNAVVCRAYVISRVIPAIKAKFPRRNKHVVLHHDNATPHAAITDELLATVFTDGWTFVVWCQPPNSPDLNVLDLGFFASIQSLQYKSVSRTVDDIIGATFRFRHNGDNQFRLPHLGKDALRRTGALMANVSCPVALLV
ncbi:hypothetical protein H310_10407 [Aphanomyces invadans]|uniref:Tc1-like transposase DDE domain-containing protein n=1 Tax=Aphanomyces invadans TaxID=157072 RepID=A0A024TS84_9STRA|nr:hypothetical protein H310_10407 [Aphanomyces invadans]ETV96217.1 hypothetical protein H310_10407 [Aphanomyces invadans]|eukprot:XP_008875009.1 hypothetical protein H310_10407 [Aphanomyces invadans]